MSLARIIHEKEEGTGDDGQTLTITALSNNTGLIPTPTINYANPNMTGTFSFTPVFGQSGAATITLKVQDNGGTLDGGIDTITRTFVINVQEITTSISISAPTITFGSVAAITVTASTNAGSPIGNFSLTVDGAQPIFSSFVAFSSVINVPNLNAGSHSEIIA